MSDVRTPRGSEWDDVVELLHRFANVMTSRVHYPEGHPAIARAVRLATERFSEVLASIPELVVALIDGEFLICDRPMPDLSANLATLASAMARHDIECIVFMRGLDAAECEHLGKTLVLGNEAPGRVREAAQQNLTHILLRFAEVRTHDKEQAYEVHAAALLPSVQRLLDHVVQSFANEQTADLTQIRALARRIVSACSSRSYTLLPRCYVPGIDDQAAHATNVAMMTASLALAGRVPEPVVVEITAAALLHDIGTLLSPVAIRGMPEPILDPQQRGVFRNHPVIGAWALLTCGCPPLWISVALEHHRGIDGAGYPTLDSRTPPHELVRTVSLASFFDRKRTLLDGRVDDPDTAIRQASELEASYFGPPLVTRFLRTFGIYPPGTIVELSDRQAALVTHASPYDPARPHVRLLTGPNADRPVDLRHRNVVEGRHELSIARAILAPLARRDPLEQESPAGVAPAAAAAEPVRRASETQPPPLARAAPRPSSPPPVDGAGNSEADVLARLGGGHVVPVLPRADLSGIALDHREGYVLTFVDGICSLEELLDATGLPRAEVLGIVEGLVRAGIVHLG